MPKKPKTPKAIKPTKKITSALLSSIDAATYLSCAATTLKLSRATGQLFSVQAPAYLKIGRTIRYKIETLDAWLSQFDETQNTAQAAQTNNQ